MNASSTALEIYEVIAVEEEVSQWICSVYRIAVPALSM